MDNLPIFKAFLSGAPKNIVITVHQRPNGDALGTGLGLAALLRKLHHRVQVIAPTAYPAFHDWIPGASEVIVCASGQQERSFKLLQKADVIFCVDFSRLTRLNEMAPVVKAAAATKVIIDHHPATEVFGDLIFRDTRAASTTALLYEMIEALGYQDLVDQDISECLYTGIMTDTGSFKHANATAKTHLVAASLIRNGADVTKVSTLVYDLSGTNLLPSMPTSR